MKKAIFIIALFAFSIQSIAQNAVPSPATLKKFNKSTTYVVLDQSMFGTTYNEKIKTAMDVHWKITPYEFITKSQYNLKRENHNASFLAKTEVVFKNDKQKIPYQFLNLMMGNISAQVTLMPDIANFPLAYTDANDDNYSYKLGMILIFMQNHIKTLEENPKLTEKTIIKYYNNNRTKIHDKTLYILKEELSSEMNTINKIKTRYPHSVKIVDKATIEKAITEKDENVVFFHVVKPEKESPRKERCYKIIMGASDAHLYYWNMHKISEKKPAGILPQDFKALSK
ncbi:MAG: hypothetical protein KAI79_06495 [Bacteroidales bacterium]|nr:hypothetical protein [Bacteroidales bacterium]